MRLTSFIFFQTFYIKKRICICRLLTFEKLQDISCGLNNYWSFNVYSKQFLINKENLQNSQKTYCFYTQLVCVQNNYICIYRDNISYAEMHLLSVIGAGIYVNMLQKGSQETNIVNMGCSTYKYKLLLNIHACTYLTKKSIITAFQKAVE